MNAISWVIVGLIVLGLVFAVSRVVIAARAKSCVGCAKCSHGETPKKHKDGDCNCSTSQNNRHSK